MKRNLKGAYSAVICIWLFLSHVDAQNTTFPISISVDPPLQIPHGLSLLPQIWSTENPVYRQQFIQSAERSWRKETATEQALLLKDVQFKMNDIKYIFYADRLREASRKTLGTRDVAVARGEKTGHDHGMDDAVALQSKILGRAAFNLNRLEGVAASGTLPVPSVNHDKIAGLLQNVSSRYSRSDCDRFGEALLEVNMAAINAFNQALSLSPAESGFAKRRYMEIHPSLTQLLYRKYIQLWKAQNTGRHPNFYAFPNYRAAEKFNFLVRGCLHSVLDAVYTYVLEDWGVAARLGLKAGGSLNIAAVQWLMPRLEE